jgi:hypothetical protein
MQVAKFCSTLTGNHTGARVRQKKNHTGAEVFLFLSKLGRLEMKSREKKIRTKKRKTNDDKKIKSKKRKDNKTLSQKSIEKT